MCHSAEAISRGKCRSISFARSEWLRHVKTLKRYTVEAVDLCCRLAASTNHSPALALSPTHISYKEKKRVMSSSVTLPKQVPVMPLPGALLFPHALLPLQIFEPRYREMLKHALAHHRMFCVALLKPHCVEWNSSD